MSLLLLNALLILAGPFAVVLPLAVLTVREFPGFRPVRRARPSFAGMAARQAVPSW